MSTPTKTVKKSKNGKSRNLERSRNEILNATFREVFRFGFQGVSIDSILTKTRLTKGALFHQFPNKLALGYALVDEILVGLILSRWVKPLENFENPLDGILAQLKKNMGSAKPEELKMGCPLNNLVQEMSTVDVGFQKRLNAALKLWIEGVESHIKRGQKNGTVTRELKAREIAEYVVMSHEGFYGIIKGLPDQSLFPSLYKSLNRYFDTLRT